MAAQQQALQSEANVRHSEVMERQRMELVSEARDRLSINSDKAFQKRCEEMHDGLFEKLQGQNIGSFSNTKGFWKRMHPTQPWSSSFCFSLG